MIPPARNASARIEQTGGPQLRIEFVELLFALAIAQVAIHAADLISVNASWNEMLPALAHLFVGLIVISASWVGWKQSRSPGMSSDVQRVFSLPFLGLLLDVLLVILYFIVVRSVEIEQKNGVTGLVSPSASPESFWLVMVFAVYAVWDLLGDVFWGNALPTAPPLQWIWKAIRAAFVSAITSVICLFLTYITWRIAEQSTAPAQVVGLDAMLICVVLLFRLLKRIENPLSSLLAVTDCKAFSKRREVNRYDNLWCIALLLIYVVILLVVSG